MRQAFVVFVGLLLSSVLRAGPAEDEALIEAIKGGDLKLAQGALEKGANVEAKGPSGVTALGVATLWRRLDVAEELLKRGANLNATVSGCTPLCLAMLSGYPEFIALLTAKGGSVGTPSGGSTVLSMLLFAGMKQTDFDSMQAAGKYAPIVAKDPTQPDFSGVWSLDRKRSVYKHSPKLPETTLKVWQLGDYLTTDWNGSISGYIIEGGQTVNQRGDTSARTAVTRQQNTLVFQVSVEERNKATQTDSTWRLEDGGKELNIKRETKTPKPGTADLIFVQQERSVSK